VDTKLLSGTVEMMILEVISAAESYGYQITQRVLNRSDGRFELKEGSLYPALHRLERQKLVAARWSEHDGRRRKYYRLTALGKKSLSQKRSDWEAFSASVNSVLGIENA
jgi:transcriptional regulator